MVPKCGRKNIWHWAHHAGDCDHWNEGETDWHLSWKLRAPAEWCEVRMPPHRADIRRAHDGLVLELQHSSISPDEIESREAFYGSMWWLFDLAEACAAGRFRFRRRANGLWTAHQLNYRGKYDYVKKPMFWDLGGPVLAFGKPYNVRETIGCHRLLSRAEFIAMMGLAPLTPEEAGVISHYIVEETGESPGGTTGGLTFSRRTAIEWATSSDGRSKPITTVRMDGAVAESFYP